MSFAQAFFLLGAAGVLGPILAHLLARPRFRRMPFTMMRFLQSGKRDMQARSRIRNLLLLLVRMAIIVLLAMLFAGPLLVTDAEPARITPLVHIGVDDSLSMTYLDGRATWFQTMQKSAAEIINAAAPDTCFCITALASDLQLGDATREEALAFVMRLRPVPAEARLESFRAALAEASVRRNGAFRLSAALLSDFTAPMLDELAKADGPSYVDSVTGVAVASGAPIVDCAVTAATVTGSTAQTVEVTATVANYGSQAVERTLRAVVGDAITARTQVTLPAGESRRVVLEIPLDALEGETGQPVEVVIGEAGDNLPADDVFRLVVTVGKKVRRAVAVFGRDEREAFLVKTALDSIASESEFGGMSTTENFYDAFTPGRLKITDAAIFASVAPVTAGAAAEIEAFVREGGRAVFFVSPDSDAAALEALFAAGVLPALPLRRVRGMPAIDVSSLAADASGLDADDKAAAAFAGYRPENILLTSAFECEAAPESSLLWTFKDGQGFLYYKRLGGGVSILVNTSADDLLGTLMRSPGVIAFLQFLLGRTSAPVSKSFTCSEAVVFPAVASEIDVAAAGRPVWVRKPDGTAVEAAVSQDALAVSCEDQFGWVATLGEPARLAGVNPPPGETDVTAVDREALDDALARVFVETAAAPTAEGNESARRLSRPVWRWFAWSLVVLVLVEAFVSNRTKR